MENNNGLAYRVMKVFTAAFSFEDISEKKAQELFDVKKPLALHLNLDIKDNIEEATLTLNIQTELQVEELGGLVKHIGSTVFKIKNMELLYDEDPGKTLKIPDELLIQFFGIAYSHARALLAVEMSPTIYKDKFFLPVINPAEFILGNEEDTFTSGN